MADTKPKRAKESKPKVSALCDYKGEEIDLDHAVSAVRIKGFTWSKETGLLKYEVESALVHMDDINYLPDVPDVINYSNIQLLNNTATGIGTIQVANTVKELVKLGFVESYTNGIFFPKQMEKDRPDLFKFLARKLCYNTFPFLYRKPSNVLKTNSVLEGKEYSFGVEIEASRSYIPNRLLPDLNCFCERDGSINPQMVPHGGPEFVTGVLNGDQGFMELQTLCVELSKRTTLTNECGVHIHVGKQDFSAMDIVNLWLLANKLEHEIFSILPKSRKGNPYCKALPELDPESVLKMIQAYHEKSNDYPSLVKLVYDSIYEMALAQIPNNERAYYKNKGNNHPKGARLGYDKSTIRYCWVNFIPAIFDTRNGSKSYTVEFRPHSASTNFTKIKNWILICSAMVYVAENRPDLVYKKDVTLEEVVLAAFPRKGEMLVKYIKDRSRYFSNASNPDLVEKKEYYKKNNKIKKTNKIKTLATCV